ncbi:hypothetical protein ACIPQA_33490 [Streptomyces sp. NPDC090109]|uniref:hypothetical protein n=1 Tax=unclassified Streptomyces TaxID=2593676 RepID=UPI0013686E25|nr:hypothetical protein [Streptomyces sp. SID5770]MZE56983.1 hypothetical protein [Streptomyces sp. SID5770]
MPEGHANLDTNAPHADTNPAADGCPAQQAAHDPMKGDGIRQWWPDRLDLDVLRRHTATASLHGNGFGYAAAFGGSTARRRA